MSFVNQQPLYKRFSLGRQCPISYSDYHGPPSFNYRPTISSTSHSTPVSPHVKQKMYITFSKPPHPVTNQ